MDYFKLKKNSILSTDKKNDFYSIVNDLFALKLNIKKKKYVSMNLKRKINFRKMSYIRQFLGLNIWIKVLVVFAFLWSIMVFLFVSKLNASNNSLLADRTTNNRINQAISYLEESKKANLELRNLIDDYIK